MNRNLIVAVGLGTSLLAASLALGVDQEGTPFTRIYKLGEKVTYSTSHGLKGGQASAETLDVELTVKKLLDRGRAELGVHFSDVHSSDPRDAATPDLTLATGDHNMPTGFSPKDRTAEAALPFLFLASSTIDKPVKVGDEAPLKWHSDLVGFDGTIKVLEISTEKKTLKALIKVKMDVQGNVAGDLTFTSSYNLIDGSLIASVGEFPMGSMVQEFKFSRKQAGE
ncbi:MAG: hypothetical protein ACHQ50_04555 [Fimbriimonadales bacterium]